MISAKRMAQLAKKWQRMAALGRKRLTWGTAAKGGADECCTTSVASKGHCTVYTADGARFEVPLAWLGTAVFVELLRMSGEEFGFGGGDDGRITLPCDATAMEYAMCLLRRGASAEVEKAFLSTMAMPHHCANRVAPCVAACCCRRLMHHRPAGHDLLRLRRPPRLGPNRPLRLQGSLPRRRHHRGVLPQLQGRRSPRLLPAPRPAAAVPPRLYLSWPAGDGPLDRFFVVAAHRDAVLLQMIYPIPVPGSDFLYTAGGDGSCGPSLHRLPSLDGTMAELRGKFEDGTFSFSNQRLRRLEALDIGVLRRGDDDYALAELQIDRFAKVKVELHVLCPSRSDRWKVTNPEITIHDTEVDLETLLFNWYADTVVSVGNYLCWVDYCLGGILLCNVFDDSADLRYLPFPAKIPGMDRDIHGISWSDLYQTVGVNEDHGVLKFVMVVQGDGQMIGEKFMAESGFRVSSWTLKTTENNMSWVLDAVLESDDLWKLDAFEKLPRAPLQFPAVSMADPSIVCFVLREEGREKIVGHEYDETWSVAIDMSNMAVVSYCQYINGKDENLSPEDHRFIKFRYGYFDPFRPSELPKYLKANGARAGSPLLNEFGEPSVIVGTEKIERSVRFECSCQLRLRRGKPKNSEHAMLEEWKEKVVCGFDYIALGTICFDT
ncbi:hypothetical protein U9M48_015083 [Paspalum notatum var. saurae]|uniref:DUF1618 domain-containing protein n=1 Tax=Paspalum notatum var. saurae TaxID=547442 RepID=A0AAQ3WL59_PASNO